MPWLDYAPRLTFLHCLVRQVHDYNHLNELLREENPTRPPLSEEMLEATPPVIRPLIAVHPATRVPALYIPDCHISKIYSLETGQEVARESVVPDYVKHITKEPFVYGHQWEAGDLIIWDNRSTLHAPTYFDSTKHDRLMWRLTMDGEEIFPHSDVLGKQLAAAMGQTEGPAVLAKSLRSRL